ncbi:hypothetical protein niasHS_006484 [Heterodera schachtii]|uniref:MICOS complex subunit n=1 Tax=Heterodera schachtii TaxID=97005 RepID=A0ABD2JHG9_HETSC
MGSSASESPPPPKLVAIKDLPIYKAESVPAVRAARPVDTIGRPATLGEEVFGNFRLVALQLRDFVSEKLGIVNSSLAPIRDAANATEQFILDEQRKVLPRAVAISVGGMAGFVAAMRKGGRMRRTFYPLVKFVYLTLI